MYLTTATISVADAHRLGLADGRGTPDGHAWHRMAWNAFEGQDLATRNFLTRLEPTDGGLRLTIRSPSEARRPRHWTGTWETTSLPSDLLYHGRYDFRLRANPTYRPLDGHRQPVAEEDVVHWLERKAALSGFAIVPGSLRMAAKGVQPFRNHELRGRHAFVDFAGTLVVTDLERFAAAFRNGIGAAKGFHFGMLDVSPTTPRNLGIATNNNECHADGRSAARTKSGATAPAGDTQ